MNEPEQMKTIEATARRPRRLTPVALAVALLAAAAAGAGGTVLAHRGPTMAYIALAPEPVSAMKDGAMVALQGEVAERFGNKFVLQDGSGRALIETGPRGAGGRLVAQNEPVTIQGRFVDGFVHAVSIRHADGHTDELDPPPPPRERLHPGPRTDGPPPA